MVLIHENGYMKLLTNPRFSTPIQMIAQRMGKVELLKCNVGEIKEVSVSRQKISFTVSVNKKKYDSCRKKEMPGIMVEIKNSDGLLICEQLMKSYKENLTFGWSYE